MTEQPATSAGISPKILALPIQGGEYLHLFDEQNTHQYHSGCVTLKPGEAVGEHSTDGHEEIIVFLSGSAQISSEHWPQPQPAVAPAVAYMPPHTLHNVVNAGEDLLRYVYIVAKV
jgi:quercetin dioxygenase-like cupin family protein